MLDFNFDLFIESAVQGKERVIFCPYCNHHKKKLSISTETGAWHCWVCEEKGGLKKLCEKLDIPYEGTRGQAPQAIGSGSKVGGNMDVNELLRLLGQRNTEEVKDYLSSRKIEKWKTIGFTKHGFLTFPMVDPGSGTLLGIKARKVSGAKDMPPYYVKGVNIGFIPDVQKFQEESSVVVVEGEIDALSLYQLGFNAYATGGKDNLLGVHYLKRFKEVLIWPDVDEDPKVRSQVARSTEGLKDFLIQQNKDQRVYVVEALDKDPNEMLMRGGTKEEAEQLLTKAREKGKKTHKAASFYKGFLEYITNAEGIKGTPTGVVGIDNALGGGKRLGEITAWQAEAKTGKNTLWHNMFYQWMKQGIPVSYASRELRPESEVLPDMLSVHLKRSLLRMKDEEKEPLLPICAQEINAWPLYFAGGYGTFDFEEIAQWVLEGVQEGVKFFALDHFHYCLVEPENTKEISKLIKLLKTLVVENQIHLDLIIQPKYLDEGRKLGLSTLRGGASIGQAIDNLFIIERVKDEGVKFINRVKLEVARSKIAKPGKEIYMQYDPSSHIIAEIDKEVVEQMKKPVVQPITNPNWNNGGQGYYPKKVRSLLDG